VRAAKHAKSRFHRHASLVERLMTGIRTGCYKMPDNQIHAVIGQKSGQSSKFDVMQDQAGIDHRYSHSNLEYVLLTPRAVYPHSFRETAGCRGLSSLACVCFTAPTPHGKGVRVRVVEPTCTKSMQLTFNLTSTLA